MNQWTSPWTAEAIETALRILGTCITVAEACAVTEEHLGRTVNPDGLNRLFKRHKLRPPSEYLAGKATPKIERPPPVETPLPNPPAASIPPVAPSQRPYRSTPERVYLVCSDVHVPSHSQPVMDAFVAIGKDVSAHGVVSAGDFLDLNEVSRHSAGSVAKLQGQRMSDSFAAGRAMLQRLVHEIDCTDNFFLDGNHEFRLTRWLHSGDNAVWMGTDAMEIDKALELRELGFQYRSGWPEAHVMLGHLLATHGRYTNLHHAKKHLDTYRCACIYGHTHRPQLAYAPGFKSQQVAIGLGHCADITAGAMDYAPTPNGWINGFGLVAVRPSGVFHAEQINFYDDVTSFGGHLYGKGGRL